MLSMLSQQNTGMLYHMTLGVWKLGHYLNVNYPRTY